MRFIVAGTGPDVGKTIVSAILATALKADYWKPIECGCSDSALVKKWLNSLDHHVYAPAYSLVAPLSPHHAARLENRAIIPEKIIPPVTKHPLVIESCGGIFVPITSKRLTFDLFKTWDAKWIVVSLHYIGSINHTLLTLESLKNQGIAVLGIIFNGPPNPDSETAILSISKVPFLGRLLPETHINKNTIQRYATQWQLSLKKTAHLSGTHLQQCKHLAQFLL